MGFQAIKIKSITLQKLHQLIQGIRGYGLLHTGRDKIETHISESRCN